MLIENEYIIRFVWWGAALIISTLFLPFIILALTCRWTTYDWCNDNCLERETVESTTPSPAPSSN